MNRLLLMIAALGLLLGVTAASYSEETAADVDVLALAKAAEDAVLFSEDFEGPNPHAFVQWYGGTVPFTIKERGVTNEEARSGTHSFKIAIETTNGGSAYFRIPVTLPRWSDLTVTIYLKATPADAGHAGGVSLANPTAGTAGNVMGWPKSKDDENGWAQFQHVVPANSDPADYIGGISVYCYLPAEQTVSYHIDDITVTGRLPVDYEQLHRRIKQPIDEARAAEHREKLHPVLTRRLRDLAARLGELLEVFVEI